MLKQTVVILVLALGTLPFASGVGVVGAAQADPPEDLHCPDGWIEKVEVGSDFGPTVTFPQETTFCVKWSTINSGIITATSFTTPDGKDISYYVIYARVPSQSPDVIVQKSTSTASVVPGQQFSYTLVAENVGDADATGVEIQDQVPSSLAIVSVPGGCTANGNAVTCGIGTLGVGQSVSVTLTVEATTGACPKVDNFGTVSANNEPADKTGNNTSGTVRVDVACSSSISFSKSGPGTVIQGGSVTYTIGVQNNGALHSQPLTVTDNVDASLTNVQASASQGSCTVNGNAVSCSLGPIAAGGSVTVTITATAPTGACPEIPNFAKVQEGTRPATATNTVLTQVTGCAPDVTSSKSGPATVAQGGTVTYTIGVQNSGNAPSDPVTVTDTVDASLTNVQASASQGSCTVSGNSVSCSLGSIAAGGSATVTITATAPIDTCPTITNAAEIQQGNQPPQSTDTVTTTVTGCTPDTPDVQITKSASTSAVAVGGSFSYTIVVSNTGSGDAQNVVVTDSVPSGLTITNVSGPGCSSSGQNLTCNVGTLAAGASATITITVTATAGACPSVSNSAHVTWSDGQGTAGSANSNAVVVGVNCEPDVQIVKNADAPARGVDSGDSFTYTITVTNDGTATAEGVVVSDTIPDGLTIEDVSGPGCSVQKQVVTCNVGNLAAGASATITITVTATDGACPDVENFAHVEWNEGEETVSEDSNVVQTDVECVGGETVTPTTPPPSATSTTSPDGTAFTGPSDGAVRLGMLAIALLVLGTGLMYAGYRRRARPEA